MKTKFRFNLVDQYRKKCLQAIKVKVRLVEHSPHSLRKDRTDNKFRRIHGALVEDPQINNLFLEF
jgi:hypothetical protein